MKKEGMEKFAILAVLVVVVGFIFMNASFNFTGNVVLEDYTTQEECEATEVGGYWYEGVCYDEEPVCSLDFLELCDETDCEGIGYWYNDECNAEEQSVCDSDNLDLCLTQEECEAIEVGGYWWTDNTCNSAGECIPETCSSLNYECGSVSDGCESTLDCGTCGSGHTCSSGTCEEDEVSDDDKEIKSTTIISSNPVTGSAVSDECASDWQCSGWSECIDGTQTRTCEDVNDCGSQDGIPATSQSCAIAETCFDKIKNQNEKGVDCGGVCEKKCSIFTIVGSVISGPIESGKEFFVKNKIIAFVILGIVVLGVGGFFGLKFFLKKSNKKVSEFFLNLFPKKLPFFNTTKI